MPLVLLLVVVVVKMMPGMMGEKVVFVPAKIDCSNPRLLMPRVAELESFARRN